MPFMISTRQSSLIIYVRTQSDFMIIWSWRKQKPFKTLSVSENSCQNNVIFLNKSKLFSIACVISNFILFSLKLAVYCCQNKTAKGKKVNHLNNITGVLPILFSGSSNPKLNRSRPTSATKQTLYQTSTILYVLWKANRDQVADSSKEFVQKERNSLVPMPPHTTMCLVYNNNPVQDLSPS